MQRFLIDDNESTFDQVFSTRNISPLMNPKRSDISVDRSSILERSIDKEVTINIVDQ
jgi:hypothetical protein